MAETTRRTALPRKPLMKRSILYIELREPYPQLLKELAEKENRSAKAQAEVLVMRELDSVQGGTN